jgi:hypothetical protein
MIDYIFFHLFDFLLKSNHLPQGLEGAPEVFWGEWSYWGVVRGQSRSGQVSFDFEGVDVETKLCMDLIWNSKLALKKLDPMVFGKNSIK